MNIVLSILSVSFAALTLTELFLHGSTPSAFFLVSASLVLSAARSENEEEES